MCWIQIDIDVVDFPGRGGGNLGCLFVYSLSMQCLRPLGYCVPLFYTFFCIRLLADCFFLFVTEILAFAFVSVAASNVSLSFLELFYNRNFLFFVVTEKVSFSVWQLLNLETKRQNPLETIFSEMDSIFGGLGSCDKFLFWLKFECFQVCTLC